MAKGLNPPKTAAQRKARPLVKKWPLEAEAQAELNRPVLRAVGSDVLVVDYAKGARLINVNVSVATVGTTGVLRDEVVENVNELERERRTQPFRDPKVFRDGRIQIPEPEAANYASAAGVGVLPEDRPAEFVIDRARIREYISPSVSARAGAES